MQCCRDHATPASVPTRARRGHRRRWRRLRGPLSSAPPRTAARRPCARRSVHDLRGQCLVAGDPLDDRAASRLIETAQRRHVTCGCPTHGGGTPAGTSRASSTRQPQDALDRPIKQLQAGRIDPMHVLEDHQHRPAAAPELRAAGPEPPGSSACAAAGSDRVRDSPLIGQRQKLGDQPDVLCPRRRRESRSRAWRALTAHRLRARTRWRVRVADDGEEGAILVVRRAKVAQARVRLTRHLLEKQRRSRATCRSPARPKAVPPGRSPPGPAPSGGASARSLPRAQPAA